MSRVSRSRQHRQIHAQSRQLTMIAKASSARIHQSSSTFTVRKVFEPPDDESTVPIGAAVGAMVEAKASL